MKILFILHIPPPIHGAAMVGQAIKVSREINTAFDGRYINLSLSDRVDTIGKNGFGKVVRYLSLLGRVIRQLLTFKPDLCYLTIQIYRIGFYKDLPMVILAKLFGVKVVYHLHNKGVSKWQHRFIDNLLYRMVFKNAEVILLSKNLYPDIQKYVPEERVHVCANGVGAKDNSQWSMVNEKRKGRKGEGAKDNSQWSMVNENEKRLGRKGEGESRTVEILFLSNLIESKGVLVLLEACHLLKNKGLGFHCTFVGGEGDISEQLLHSKIEQLNIKHYVTYAGRKFGEEKEQLLADADIFVLPTYNDCFPLVLLEAMQHALPIVSTFEGAISEMVVEDVTGFLIPQKEAKPLADKLEILITNSDLRDRMGAAGRNRFEQNYTLEIFEKRMKEILNLF